MGNSCYCFFIIKNWRETDPTKISQARPKLQLSSTQHLHKNLSLPYNSQTNDHIFTLSYLITSFYNISPQQQYIIQMHNYKGNLRREPQDYTPTKNSFEQTRENPAPRYESRNDYRYDPRAQPRYDPRGQIKNDSKYDIKYQKSELSYYQSQSSRVFYDYDHSDRPSNKSQVALSEQKYFYNSVLPVTIKSFQREQHQLRLRIQIQAKIEKGQHLMNIYLTDDSNPKFLWMFAIKEVDFMNLKAEQKLKVSYAGFPEMLENCLRDCEGQHSENRSNYLVLSIKKGGQGKLAFVESNRYKESTHLQFIFKLASDEQIKDYLSNKLLLANDEIEQSRSALRNMQHILAERMKEIEKMNAQFGNLKNERDQQREQFKLQLNQLRTELESNRLNELNKLKKESETELKEIKQKLNTQIEVLSKQKAELGNRYSEAKDKISLLESNQRDQSIKIMRLQQDFSKASKESQQSRAENRELSQRRFQNQKTITQLTCKIESLRSQLQDKKTIISSTVQLKETNNNQISSLQQQTADQKKQILRLQAKISQLQGEMLKASSNSSEYMEKISRQKEKLQERGEIIKDQEKEIKELKKNEAALERQKEKLEYDREEKENRIKNLQDQLEKMQKKFEDQQAMVAYLQKSMNEKPGLRTPTYYPTSTYQPSTSYVGANREFPSQLSTNSNVGASRATGNPRAQKTQKYEPNIKRYQDRSKSPVPNRFPQQKDPEEQEESYSQKPTKFEKPYPVKFKMSQPKQ